MDSRPQSTYLSAAAVATAFCLAVLSGVSAAQDAEVQLKSEGVKIFGQSELPKVLYIVPWKRRQAKEIEMPTSQSLTSDVLEPIDPEIFRRQIRYHDLILQSENSSQP